MTHTDSHEAIRAGRLNQSQSVSVRVRPCQSIVMHPVCQGLHYTGLWLGSGMTLDHGI